MKGKKNNKAIGSLSIRRRILLATIIAFILAFSITGSVYAVTSGNAFTGAVHLTILEQGGPADFVVTQVDVDGGTWDNNTMTWTASLWQGESAGLNVYLENHGASIGYIEPLIIINGIPHPEIAYQEVEIAPGCFGRWTLTDEEIEFGESCIAQFEIRIDPQAPAGAIPDFQLFLEI